MFLAIVDTSTDAEPLEDLSDGELMQRYADDGDVEAFELLVSRHEKPLLNYIWKRCGRRGEAEELLQEVFVRVVESASSYEQTAKFTTWLYTIARNLCIDRSRKRENKTTTYSLDKPIGDDPDDDTYVDQMADTDSASASVEHDRRAFRQKLADALDELPEKQRDVFLLREVSGMKYREVADVVDAPVATVKSRMRYALDTLRGHLADYEGHSFDSEERRQLEAGE